jgi:hypothetical protein
MPIILALGGVEAGKYKFKTSLGYIGRLSE